MNGLIKESDSTAKTFQVSAKVRGWKYDSGEMQRASSQASEESQSQAKEAGLAQPRLFSREEVTCRSYAGVPHSHWGQCGRLHCSRH